MQLSKRSAEAVLAADIVERMRQYAAASRSENTWRAYQFDLEHFAKWCAKHGIAEPIPAESGFVAAYLTDYAGEEAGEDRLSVSTLARRLYALSALHRLAGHPPPSKEPEVQLVWNGIRRTHGTAPVKKAATLTKIIRRLVKPLKADRPKDIRDRALLLIGFAGAFRRSELVAFDVGDIVETEDGLHITVRRSKSDQEGAGDVVGIPFGSHPPTCPVRAWRAWLTASEITDGAAFRGVSRHGHISPRRLSAQAVADVVKERAEAAGLDEKAFAAHSLRAGFATEAFGHGVAEVSVMRHGRWKSASSMRGYIREGSLWSDNAAAKLGL